MKVQTTNKLFFSYKELISCINDEDNKMVFVILNKHINPYINNSKCIYAWQTLYYIDFKNYLKTCYNENLRILYCFIYNVVYGEMIITQEHAMNVMIENVKLKELMVQIKQLINYYHHQYLCSLDDNESSFINSIYWYLLIRDFGKETGTLTEYINNNIEQNLLLYIMNTRVNEEVLPDLF